MNARELMAKRAGLIGQARALLDKADEEKRGLSADEDSQYQAFMFEVVGVAEEIDRRTQLEDLEAGLSKSTGQPGMDPVAPTRPGPARASDEVRAIAHYARTGDAGPLREVRASNDTDMNITTPADGGVLVPTGHFQGIVAKRNESALFVPLGVLPIPGKGTTVNVPVETGGANVFVSTSEASQFDRDAPVLDVEAMTLVKFTKKVALSDELLSDEDSALVAFLDNYVGRALALTHNSALVTEALANGTSVALADDAIISAGDPETLVYALAGEYADDAAFVLKRATEGALRKLTGNTFLYQPTPQGGLKTLSGYPIFNSEYVAAIGAGNKSLAFGNFGYMGMRQGPLTFLRDPYSAANTGQVNLFYYARIVYKVLNAEAILYGAHPTA
ncbi:MAG TPA: phage major capsid protein [bacterium]|nr:phage major capsid protein [bacterium]